MTVGRRQVMLGTLGLGVAAATGPRAARARGAETPQAFSTYGIVPGGGGIDQTARCNRRSTPPPSRERRASFRPAFTPPARSI